MSPPSTEREIRRRRRYAPSFKAKIVAACLQGDASIAQVALQHGLNTNLVQTWIRKAKRQSQLPAVPDFVPLQIRPGFLSTQVRSFNRNINSHARTDWR